MAQKENIKTLEEIKAQFKQIPIGEDPNRESEELASKIITNNYKLCLFTELFEERAEQSKTEDENDPKIELLKNAKESLEVIKELLAKALTENNELRNDLLESKLKLKEKQFFDKNRKSYIEYREKIFPMLMQDFEKKEVTINEININCADNPSENEMKQVTDELEKATKDNQFLKKTEEDIIECRRQNEAIEVETCRIQVRNIEMETEIRSFDEYVIENQIAELQQKIMDAKAHKLIKQQEKDEDDFKNPNEYPTLLDFLGKSKKNKQKKRKITFPYPSPSKRRKNKTGSSSQLDKNGNQVPSPKLRHQRSNRGQKYDQIRDARNNGQNVHIVDNSSSNLCSQPSNMLQRTCSSNNFAKVSTPRPILKRQKSIMQLESRTSGILPTVYNKVQSKSAVATEQHKNYEVDPDNRFIPPTPSLSPAQVAPENIQKSVLNENNQQVENTVESPPLEPMITETINDQVQVTRQQLDRKAIRKALKSQKVSPIKADKKNSKSPKKDIKKSRGRKKTDKNDNSFTIVSSQNQVAVNENSPTTPESAEKSMAVDEITPESDLNVVTAENSIDEFVENNQMDVDQNIPQNQELNTNMQEDVNEDLDDPDVNMEQDCSGDNISNIEIFDMEMDNDDKDLAGNEAAFGSNSFERLFSNSPTSSGNFEFNQSIDFNLDNSNDSGNKEDYFNFDTGNGSNDDFFGSNSFNSNEGKASDFF